MLQRWFVDSLQLARLIWDVPSLRELAVIFLGDAITDFLSGILGKFLSDSAMTIDRDFQIDNE